jgi:hypothetical protein
LIYLNVYNGYNQDKN